MKKLYQALQENILTVEDIKSRYGVSSRTVQRWASDEAKPKVEVQYQLNELLDNPSLLENNEDSQDDEKRISRQIDSLLVMLRESFYRWGNYSSRNEALEDLSKLLLAQFHLINSGKNGFHNYKDCGASVNVNFQFVDYINSSVEEALSDSLHKEVFKGSNYNLLLSHKNSKLIKEICTAFKQVEWNMIQSLNRLDVFNEIFGRFLADSFVDEKEMGQYLTPIEMTRFIVSLAISTIPQEKYEILIHPDKCRQFGLILDPSCGAASFLSEISQQLLPDVIAKYGKNKAKEWLVNMGKFVLVGIDKSPKMIRLAVCNLASMGIPCDNIIYDNSLNFSSDWIGKHELNKSVSLILTNPPFGAEFKGNDLQSFKLFNQWAKRFPRKIDSELLFLEKYVDWLKPNGNCVTVVPDSVLTNKNLFLDLRKGIQKFIEIDAVISFPPETFSAAGTSTKTSVFSFVKTEESSQGTYFGICKNIGFKVITKGSSRTKIRTDKSDLDLLLLEASNQTSPRLGRRFKFDDSFSRWDATYHALLNESEYNKIENKDKKDVLLTDLVDIISEKVDPRRVYDQFHYIEISNIGKSGEIQSQLLNGIEAPSRARKKVYKFDILASTVRPNQKKVGYVIEDYNNIVCTTGLVVLRPKMQYCSLLICNLLKSDFVTKQLLRSNVGIAYPAVEEKVFKTLLLPIARNRLNQLNEDALKIQEKRLSLASESKRFESFSRSQIHKWEEININ